MGLLHKILWKPGSAPRSSQKLTDLKLFILGLQHTGQGLDAGNQVEHEVLRQTWDLPSDPRKLMNDGRGCAEKSLQGTKCFEEGDGSGFKLG